MKQITTAAGRPALRRRLAVLAAAAGLAVPGCADSSAPAAPSPPSPPVVTSAPPTGAQTLDWAKSMCQALGPAFDRLGAPPLPDLGNLAATRQTYINYLSDARNATQQAMDQLSSVGPPPVDNGQQVLDNMRNQLVQLRNDLDKALAQLNRADPHDVGSTGLALGAAGNILSALGNRAQVVANLATDSRLRAAIDQTPECQSLAGANSTTGTDQPTGSPQPPN
ncbi:MAG: hypothetical protein ACRDTH_03345 [Pseudonocardiaceae bacterium]